MKLPLATSALILGYTTTVTAQTCDSLEGAFALPITGACNYATILEEYTSQVFNAAGATCTDGSDFTAKQDLDAKLTGSVTFANGTAIATGEEVADFLCKSLYDNAEVTDFTEAANKASDPTDLHFEQQFYNGKGIWQEEVETLYESEDRTATSVLREDAAKVREFYEGRGSYSRVSWPNSITNFDDATCTSNAAMCCWPKDRQANDGNGNCASPYDEDCVNKDPADNTNMCFADLAKGNSSTGFDSDRGFMAFPNDGNNGEGAIHCHGFAWANDEYDSISRYKANNLFFVSMYDHMHQRGYVKNIPGMPMCGCMEQMPIATRSDCTQVDLTEDWTINFDGTSTLTIKMNRVEIDFNACKGRGNRSNDLWTYVARLYDEGKITASQFGKVGRVLTNDSECYHATQFATAKKGFTTAYDHDATMYTKVAGRDEMFMAPFGQKLFNTAFVDQTSGDHPIIMRICPSCIGTHRKVWYRRITPIPANFDLLQNILYYSSSTVPVGNVWSTDFSLHSSYDEAVTGDNPWQCKDGNGNDKFDYYRPFVGRCSPDGTRVDKQYSIWSQHERDSRYNVAYYINKPEATGVQRASDRSVGDITFVDEDIGQVGLAGHTYENDGVYHVSGSGSDIWSKADQFHFHSQDWSGDVDVSVHITSFTNNGNEKYGKAGIMLRSDNSPDATYAFVMLTSKVGIYAQHRRSEGGNAGSSGNGFNLTPSLTSGWLRIVKKQEKIEFYRGGEDEGTWVLHATETIFFPDDKFLVGLAVCSHDNYYLSEATFEDYNLNAYNFPSAAPSISIAPTAWDADVDVGNPPRAGTFTEGTTYDSVKGTGTGIWGTSDSFFFHEQQKNLANLEAGMSVEMYIQKFDNWDLYSRGGLMIRDSNDANAANAFVGAAGYDQGAVFQSRASAGASTVHHEMMYVNSDNHFWVKLDMTTDGLVTASYKESGGNAWIELGSVQMTLTGSSVLVGQAVTKGTSSTSAVTMLTEQYAVSP